jgi:hypothetical protein
MKEIMTIFVTGDSHSLPFTHHAFVISPGPLTISALARKNHELRQKTELILKHYTLLGAKRVILCIGEISVRSHFWRSLPVYLSRGDSIEGYLAREARLLYDTVAEIANLFMIEIILWGPPPGVSNPSYENPEWPRVGDTRTRNILSHKFNLEIIKILHKNKERGVRFISLFYDYIDEHLQVSSTHFSDGLHWNSDLSSEFISKIESFTKSNQVICIDSFKTALAIDSQIKFRLKMESTELLHESFAGWFSLEEADIVCSKKIPRCHLIIRPQPLPTALYLLSGPDKERVKPVKYLSLV